jgi:hypothetical protein
MLRTALALASVGLCAAANAGWSGATLLELDKPGTTSEALLLGYVAGLLDSEPTFVALMDSGDLANVRRTSLFCPPSAATIPQARDVVMKFVRSAPERQHEAAYLLARGALVAAWPCAASKPK